MGDPKFFPSREKRLLYNAFYGSLPSLPEQKKYEKFSALDIAPTLLHCAGARWSGDQFGLGISLFSERKTLLEEYGKKELDTILEKRSKFYTKFY